MTRLEIRTEKVPALVQIPVRRAPRPLTRVDNFVIWPGGGSRELTRWERLRLFFRWPELRLAPLSPEQVRLQNVVDRAIDEAFLHGTTRLRVLPRFCPHCGRTLERVYPTLRCSEHGPIVSITEQGERR